MMQFQIYHNVTIPELPSRWRGWTASAALEHSGELQLMPGSYVAWTAFTQRPVPDTSHVKSACAWQVGISEKALFPPIARVTEHADSRAWRAAVAAITGAMESVYGFRVGLLALRS